MFPFLQGKKNYALELTSGNPTSTQDTLPGIRATSHALRAAFYGAGSWLPFLESARVILYTEGELGARPSKQRCVDLGVCRRRWACIV